MKKITYLLGPLVFGGLLSLLLFKGIEQFYPSASAISVPKTFTNGEVLFAADLNSNNTTVYNAFNSHNHDGSDGEASTIAPSGLASNLLPTDATYTLGDSTHNFKSLFLDNGATDAGTINFNAGAGSFLKSIADGTQLQLGAFTTFVPSSTGVASLGTTALRWGALRLNTNITSSTPDSNTLYADLIPKAWGICNSAGTLQASVNLTSSRTGTGQYTWTFKTALANATYSPVVTTNLDGTFGASTGLATGSFNTRIRDTSNTLTDAGHVVIVIGQQ